MLGFILGFGLGVVLGPLAIQLFKKLTTKAEKEINDL